MQRLSIIEEGEPKQVRMANLASLGSHAINGVAALHTELLKATILKDFHTLFPEKILEHHQRGNARGAGWCSATRGWRS